MNDVFDIDSWIKFAFFIAGSLWLAALGVAAFWLRALITRYEGASDSKGKRTGRRNRTNSHARDIARDARDIHDTRRDAHTDGEDYRDHD